MKYDKAIQRKIRKKLIILMKLEILKKSKTIIRLTYFSQKIYYRKRPFTFPFSHYLNSIILTSCSLKTIFYFHSKLIVNNLYIL